MPRVDLRGAVFPEPEAQPQPVGAFDADADVFADRQFREYFGDLEGASHAHGDPCR